MPVTMMSRLYLVLFSFLLFIAGTCSAGSNSTDEKTVNCTLCSDPSLVPNDPDARVNTGTETITCQELYDRGTFVLPVENCTALQDFGRSLCLCESSPPQLNDCTLCEDGSALGQPLLEGLSGETCAELQIDAQRDYASNCEAWQGTVGIYCGCNNVVADVLACRLCGNDTMLPNPLDVQEGEGDSCGKLEFEASLPGANCSAHQEEHAEYCCRNVVPPTPAPTSGGYTDVVTITLCFATMIVFLVTV